MLQHHHANPTPPARVVVIGAFGFMGKNLLRHLAELGLETLPVDFAGVNSKFPSQSVSGKVEAMPLAFVDIDLTRPESVATLQEVIRPDDAVVFAAALTPDRGRDRSTMLTNVTMGDHVSRCLENTPCAHLVYISSDAVYREGTPLIQESSCCQPATLYGLGHLIREEMLREVTRRVGVPLAIVRMCPLYGPGDTHNSYGPNRFCRTAREQRKITLFGQGEEKRDHIYVLDVVRLIGLCLLYRSQGTLNLATGTSVSFMEVAQKVAELAGGDIEIEGTPRGNPITHVHYDVTNLLKAFPTFSFTSLDEGLAESFRN